MQSARFPAESGRLMKVRTYMEVNYEREEKTDAWCR